MSFIPINICCYEKFKFSSSVKHKTEAIFVAKTVAKSIWNNKMPKYN